MRVEILSTKRLFDDFFKVDEAILRHETRDGEMRTEDIWDKLDRGEIADAKTLVALMWLRRRLRLL